MTSSDANSKADVPSPAVASLDHSRHRGASRCVKTQFPFGGPCRAGRGPEVKKAILGYIALMDASPLVIAKEKACFAKPACRRRGVEAGVLGRDARQRRAGLEKNGIDGAHILTPMPT